MKKQKHFTTFNCFDICEAWYCYAIAWHCGHFSKEYAIIARLYHMYFVPSLLINGYKDLNKNAKCIYLNLVNGYSKIRKV